MYSGTRARGQGRESSLEKGGRVQRPDSALTGNSKLDKKGSKSGKQASREKLKKSVRKEVQDCPIRGRPGGRIQNIELEDGNLGRTRVVGGKRVGKRDRELPNGQHVLDLCRNLGGSYRLTHHYGRKIINDRISEEKGLGRKTGRKGS